MEMASKVNVRIEPLVNEIEEETKEEVKTQPKKLDKSSNIFFGNLPLSVRHMSKERLRNVEFESRMTTNSPGVRE